ncbi:hypothetical protein [Kineosporia babensis]|uniref:Uncharacterized protein n=1 Tax=Kineosporia babensis TaxID=499548 RepID=A0A9X1NF36_9ACTN|nr:hypothetical protein [Kineosporia babensis]MCD5312983.1 hypothetical protein [Kineosporia babensis]
MRQIQHDASHLWTTTTVVDTEAIDHERPIARVALETESILIRVAQRVDFNLLSEPVDVLPYPPRITLGDYELNDAHAREIARHLLEAVEFVEGLGWTRRPGRPRLVPRA